MIYSNPGFISIAAGSVTETKLSESLATVAIATGTLGTEKITQVTYAAALCTLTLPASTATWAVALTRYVRKSNASAFTIVLTPDAGSTINGGAANAPMTLPGSNIPSATTASDMYWAITRDATATWRVSSAQMANATSTVAGLESPANNVTIARGLPLSSTQVIASGTTGTIAATDRTVRIATGSGNFSLTCAALAEGHEVEIIKTSSDTNTITLIRTSTETINGAAASYPLPGSASAVGYIAWTLIDESATARLVV